MCDKCDLDLAMYGEVRTGFRCSDVTDELLTEEANGVPRFPHRKKAAGQWTAEGYGDSRTHGDENDGR
ncbi:hypothetical protein [Oricola sp.]|uniref:hypothetical protein n=1 Tax=Oricola sp. TaxID=1979950 RepID=UPI000C8FC81E|nr:hypothetical protein [Ahrensia sp.]MCK5749442.1 hypothetical protein [Oricola sp.]|tara:strand:+ start:39840 stop:40043 length:204 start_codon:yes stop_codon:yes gene_type:complete